MVQIAYDLRENMKLGEILAENNKKDNEGVTLRALATVWILFGIAYVVTTIVVVVEIGMDVSCQIYNLSKFRS